MLSSPYVFLSELKNICLQKRCAICEEPYNSKDVMYGICEKCTKVFKPIKTDYCMKCGEILPLQGNPPTTTCKECENPPPLWSELRFYNIYENELQKVIQEAKFYNNLLYLHLLADIVRPLVYTFPHFDAIVPIPLHTKKLLHRGYNQCIEIAKHLNKTDGFPYNTSILQKTVHTKAQSSLSRAQRLQNAQNVFVADTSQAMHKTFLLFDDVCTTGATLHAASQALLHAGAKDVYVLYIAKTAHNV